MPYYRCPACGLTGYSAARHSQTRVCPNCSRALPEDARRYPTPKPADVVERVIAARPAAISEARRSLFQLAVSPGMHDKLALVLSELVTNAVLHAGLPAGHPVNLQMTSDAGRVRLAVHDDGQGFDRAALGPRSDALAVGGQGLSIVAALSDDWGVERRADGCTVWCEVTEDEASERIRPTPVQTEPAALVSM